MREGTRRGRSENGEDGKTDREGETLEGRGYVLVPCSHTTLRLGMFPLLVGWNEFAGTPMEASVDSSITTENKLTNGVRVSGRRD